ncbi:hypothetical protein GOP47_0023797 [Adiantum capillus-veneris]|uniref:BHLH domain-containing protein n=1 Tax=Adiantum capillus-veneris TaxID=13818 RepID=A0A9D4U4K5_ADICA|nr:hypothetical protein GOP47_0023797 [Adiantum capillus-veneris]
MDGCVKGIGLGVWIITLQGIGMSAVEFDVALLWVASGKVYAWGSGRPSWWLERPSLGCHGLLLGGSSFVFFFTGAERGTGQGAACRLNHCTGHFHHLHPQQPQLHQQPAAFPAILLCEIVRIIVRISLVQLLPSCSSEDSSSNYNACSIILSMDCQHLDLQSATKTTNGASLHLTSNINKDSTSCVSSNVDDDQKGEEMEDNTHSGTLQGSVIFDMLSAMQFNSHSTAAKSTLHQSEEQTSANYLHTINGAPSKAYRDGSLPWNINLYNSNEASQDHMESGYLSIKDNMQPVLSAHPTGFDPISSFLKLPVLADPTKLELADQRLLSSYSSFINSYKEDQYGPIASTLGNNWFNSLQLENIRPGCSLVANEDMEDESHIVHFLDHSNEQNVSQAGANLEMKLNNGGGLIHAQEGGLSSEKDNLSTLNMFSNYHNEEQLLYAINEGGDTQRIHGDTMMDRNMQMIMMGYNENARTTEEHGVIKGSTSSSIMGTNIPIKAGRRRGVRGSIKNSEERESQRMTHIAVERNRRRQMNEHLRVLRALMPPSYIQRGDQASIIGGAIEFVKELEQLLQCLESQKRRRMMANPTSTPQPLGYGYTSDNQLVHHQQQQDPSLVQQLDIQEGVLETAVQLHEEVAQAKCAMVDIEVKVVERSEALIKILSQRRPRQLLHTIIALQDHLQFSILHTNVTTIDNTVLYSFTVKINNDRDYSANAIASSMHELFMEIISKIPMKCS